MHSWVLEKGFDVISRFVRKENIKDFFARWVGWGKVVSPILKFAAGKTLV